MARNTKKQSKERPVQRSTGGSGRSGGLMGKVSVVFAAGLSAAAGTFVVLSLNAETDGRALPRFEREPARAQAEIVINQFTAAEFCGHDSHEVRQKFNQARRRFIDSGVLDAREFRAFRHRAITLAERKLAQEGPEGFQTWCGTQSDSNANFFITLTQDGANAIDATFSR